MAITYFQDTIFQTDSALTAPGTGTALQVAVNNLFSTTEYTLITSVSAIDTNVVVCLEGSIDGTNYAPIIANQTITANSTVAHNVSGSPVKWIRPKFVSESGGDNSAEVIFSVAAA